jgi:uncharacterized protein (TIGR03083 family)
VTLDFPDLLRLIGERSAAFRAVIASAPSLDPPVPGCPGWTLFDLVQHLGQGRRRWAATVAAGPAAASPDKSVWESTAPGDRDALLVWWDASVQALAEALREAGPERGCWTWWGDSQSPQTCGAVARHQLQEVAVHTYDAQAAVGAPQPLPTEVALDGVEEFLVTCCATTSAWPHEPAAVVYHAAEGHSWHVRLSADGAHATASGDDEPGAVDASAWGTASELVLFFYNRIPLESVKLDGDRRQFERLIAWQPE